MAGGEILLAGDVLIYDDRIDEALEYFVVNLTFQDPDNVPPLASIESNGGDIIRIDIVDNDGELNISCVMSECNISCTQTSLLDSLYQIQHIRR